MFMHRKSKHQNYSKDDLFASLPNARGNVHLAVAHYIYLFN